MILEQASDWANIVAPSIFALLAVAGVIWWFWKRRKFNQEMKRFDKVLLDYHERSADIREELESMVRDIDSFKEQDSRAVLLSIHATLETLYYTTAIHYIASRKNFSYWPDWAKGLTIQSPIKRKRK